MHFVNAAASGAAAFERYLLATSLSDFTLHLILTAWKAALYWTFTQCKVSHGKNNCNTPINAIYSSEYLFCFLLSSLWFSSLLLFDLPQRHYTMAAWMSNEDNLNKTKPKSCLKELIAGAGGRGKKVYLLRLITHIVVQISAVMAGEQRDKTAAQSLRTSIRS